MRKWFAGVTNIEELRKKYRELLKKYHPDNMNGNTVLTQEIIAEYDAVFAELSHENHEDEQEYTHEENEQFKAIMDVISGFNMTVEIIGSWIWCFECFQYKDKLKELGFTWCSRKKAWVWHSGEYRRHHKKEIPLDEIRIKYGSQQVKNYTEQRRVERYVS